MVAALLGTFEHLKGKIKLSDALVRDVLRSSEEALLISALPGFK